MLAEEGGRREALEGGRDLFWREFDIFQGDVLSKAVPGNCQSPKLVFTQYL